MRALRVTLTVLLSLLLLASVAVAATGVWFVREIGTSGSARFTAEPGADTVLVAGPQVLARNQAPVRIRVEASDPDAQLWAGLARPSDAEAALADVRRTQLTGVDLDGWQVRTRAVGTETGQRVSTGDIWTSTQTATGAIELDIARADGAQTLVVTGADGDAADLDAVTLTWSEGRWFVQALAVTIGAFVLGLLAAVLLWRRTRRALRARRARNAAAVPVVGAGDPSEPSADGQTGDGAQAGDESLQDPVGARRQGNDEETIVLRLDESRAAADDAAGTADETATAGADPTDSNTTGADPTGADPTGADPNDSDTTDTNPTQVRT